MVAYRLSGVPNVEVRTVVGRARLHAVLGSGRHVLLVSGVPVRTALDTAGLNIYAGVVDVVGGGLDTMNTEAFVLVRPDGILAARGSRNDVHKVIDYLRQICGGGAAKLLVPLAAPPNSSREGDLITRRCVHH
jgi:hypothetical protein